MSHFAYEQFFGLLTVIFVLWDNKNLSYRRDSASWRSLSRWRSFKVPDFGTLTYILSGTATKLLQIVGEMYAIDRGTSI